MRFILGLLLITANPAVSAPLMIEADKVLGVYAISEYGENDWNNDDHSDLAVLAVSDAGDGAVSYTHLTLPTIYSV